MDFCEERQDLESPLLEGSTQGVGGSQDSHRPRGGDIVGHSATCNTYIEFFKLLLNFTIHFNGTEIWISNRKCFNEQQGSV